MTDADCFKAVRKLARANAKLLRQQRVLEADLIDAQLTILKQQAQLEAAAIANAGEVHRTLKVAQLAELWRDES